MGKGIKVSPKHGLNPTIPICFWCGKERGEVALLGRLPGDAEAPKNVVLDYEPCECCRAGMARGFTLMEATSRPNDRGQVEAQAIEADGRGKGSCTGQEGTKEGRFLCRSLGKILAYGDCFALAEGAADQIYLVVPGRKSGGFNVKKQRLLMEYLEGQRVCLCQGCGFGICLHEGSPL